VLKKRYELKIKVIKTRIPKTCICPDCKRKQPFKKNRVYWKIVKDMDLDNPVKLKVRMITAKCINPSCKRKTFTLPVPGIERYKRSTSRLIAEAVAGIVQDNSTLPRISKRLTRIFNTTGSKSTIDRWKHALADKYDIADIIKALDFSGILGLDEYKPLRSYKYELISTDGLKSRILYIQLIDKRNFSQVEDYLNMLVNRFDLHPWAIIFDLWKPFPGVAKKVFGKDILIQYDYFHIMKVLHWHLRNALAQYRKYLKEIEDPRHSVIWKYKWVILKNA
jgi:transposase